MISNIAKRTNTFKEFVIWYNKYLLIHNIEITKFVLLPFTFQVGVLLKFLEDVYDIGIHADDASFLVYYLMKKDLS